MIKWFAYIVLLLIFAQCLSSVAKAKPVSYNRGDFSVYRPLHILIATDTSSKKQKQQQEEEKKKIKEISKAKRQTKPEKIDDDAVDAPTKPKRVRRPEGMERPPEIPRRNEN